MPEGDTIALIAARLEPVLAGEVLTRFEAQRLSGQSLQPGERITSVRAQGKYLTISFSDGLAVQTHLGMVGSWHLYETGEAWQRPAQQARLVIGVRDRVAVCFRAPTVRVFRAERTDPLAHLGPDLCQRDVDLDSVVARVFQLTDPETDIATAVLDQRVAAGIGNVYKSEALFATGVHPRRRRGELSADDLVAIYSTAHRQLLANLGPGPRTTVPQGLAVYGRAGQPCWICATRVESAQTGQPARFTYWCPTCQPG